MGVTMHGADSVKTPFHTKAVHIWSTVEQNFATVSNSLASHPKTIDYHFDIVTHSSSGSLHFL